MHEGVAVLLLPLVHDLLAQRAVHPRPERAQRVQAGAGLRRGGLLALCGLCLACLRRVCRLGPASALTRFAHPPNPTVIKYSPVLYSASLGWIDFAPENG